MPAPLPPPLDAATPSDALGLDGDAAPANNAGDFAGEATAGAADAAAAARPAVVFDCLSGGEGAGAEEAVAEGAGGGAAVGAGGDRPGLFFVCFLAGVGGGLETGEEAAVSSSPPCPADAALV